MTTKLHCVTDGEGRPLQFRLTGGQVADCTQARSLLESQKGKAVLADKGYDTDAIIHFIKRRMKAKAVIPPKLNRKIQRRYDKLTFRTKTLEALIFLSRIINMQNIHNL